MPHPPMPETAFEISDLDDVIELRRRLIDLGYPRTQVTGCVDLVVSTVAGEDPALPAPTASRYRKMLRRLLAEEGRPWPPPRVRSNGQPAPEARPAAASERGEAAVGALVALAGAGAVLLVPHGLQALLPPIIHERVNTEEREAPPAAWRELRAA